jgi:hypothetical protein
MADDRSDEEAVIPDLTIAGNLVIVKKTQKTRSCLIVEQLNQSRVLGMLEVLL